MLSFLASVFINTSITQFISNVNIYCRVNISSPDYVDPNTIAQWQVDWPNAIEYNHSVTGNSQYKIDLADLNVLADDWLWIACWKQQELETAAAQPMQSETLSMQPLMMSVSNFSAAAVPVENVSIVEPEPEVSSEAIVQILGFLNEIEDEAPESFDEIQEMKVILTEELMSVLKLEENRKLDKTPPIYYDEF